MGSGEERSFNYALALLKLVACFGVVSLHFGAGGFGRKLAVPLFVTITFYFGAKAILSGDWSGAVRRLRRLLVPFVAWGAVAAAFAAVTTGVSMKGVLEQLAFGRSEGLPGGHLYYLEVCAFLTVLLFGAVKAGGVKVLAVLSVLALALQCAGLNAAWCGALPSEAPNTVGRLAEFLPYACAGVLFACGTDRLRGASAWLLGACVTGAFGLYAVTMRWVPAGFGYQGAPLLVLTLALFAFFAFAVSRFAWLRRPWLKEVSSWCGGAYFMHMVVGTLIVRRVGLGPSLVLTAVVYVLSMVLAGGLGRWTVLKGLVR